MDNNSEESMKQVKQREMENKLSNREIMKKKGKKKKEKKKLSYYLIPRFPCMRLEDGVTAVETPAGDGSFEMEAGCSGRRDHSPTHLVVTVNGIIGRYKSGNHFLFIFSFTFYFICETMG